MPAIVARLGCARAAVADPPELERAVRAHPHRGDGQRRAVRRVRQRRDPTGARRRRTRGPRRTIPAALAIALARLATIPVFAAHLARRGRARVLTRFTHARIAEQTYGVYRTMAGECATARAGHRYGRPLVLYSRQPNSGGAFRARCRATATLPSPIPDRRYCLQTAEPASPSLASWCGARRALQNGYAVPRSPTWRGRSGANPEPTVQFRMGEGEAVATAA